MFNMFLSKNSQMKCIQSMRLYWKYIKNVHELVKHLIVKWNLLIVLNVFY